VYHESNTTEVKGERRAEFRGYGLAGIPEMHNSTVRLDYIPDLFNEGCRVLLG